MQATILQFVAFCCSPGRFVTGLHEDVTHHLLRAENEDGDAGEAAV